MDMAFWLPKNCENIAMLDDLEQIESFDLLCF